MIASFAFTSFTQVRQPDRMDRRLCRARFRAGFARLAIDRLRACRRRPCGAARSPRPARPSARRAPRCSIGSAAPRIAGDQQVGLEFAERNAGDQRIGRHVDDLRVGLRASPPSGSTAPRCRAPRPRRPPAGTRPDRSRDASEWSVGRLSSFGTLCTTGIAKVSASCGKRCDRPPDCARRRRDDQRKLGLGDQRARPPRSHPRAGCAAAAPSGRDVVAARRAPPDRPAPRAAASDRPARAARSSRCRARGRPPRRPAGRARSS